MRKLLENHGKTVYFVSIIFLLLAVLILPAKGASAANAVEIDVIENTPDRIVLNCRPG